MSDQATARFLATLTVTYHDVDPWRSDVDVLDEAAYVNSLARKYPAALAGIATGLASLQFSLHLLRLSRRYKAVACGRYGMWFSVLQRLLGFNKRVVMMDTEWQKSDRGWLNRAASLSSAVMCCWTHAEMERYSSRYNLPPEKFAFLPMAFQKRDLREPSDDGYVFAGGFQGRDWDTFLAAVDGLPYPVKICTNRNFPKLPPNVSVRQTNRADFYSTMAAASCVVVPVLSEPLRILGMTTFTAAMAMGKVVIVSEPLGAPDYIEHGVTGFVTGYGDAKSIRNNISAIMGDPVRRAQMGEAARRHAWKEYSPSVYRERVMALLEGKTLDLSPATPRSTTLGININPAPNSVPIACDHPTEAP